MSVTVRGEHACCHILTRNSDGRLEKMVNIFVVL